MDSHGKFGYKQVEIDYLKATVPENESNSQYEKLNLSNEQKNIIIQLANL